MADRDAPTGPMWRLLRRMGAAPLVAVPAGPGKVRCALGGCPVDARLLAGLLDRELVAERDLGDRSEYTLTARGTAWAGRAPEGQS